MIKITCQELLDLRENYQFEVKAAQGRDGNGKVLQKLVEKNLFAPDGVGRGTKYYLNETFSVLKMQPSDLKVQLSDNILKIREAKRTPPNEMIEAIFELYQSKFMTKYELASLLNRKATTIRNKYLTQIIKDDLLELKYEEVNHRDQTYRTKGLRDDW